MTPTLLLDLDDTLLGNEVGNFLPAYLKALSDHLASYAAPDRLVPTLLAATQAMIQNNRPDLTLKEFFDARFYPALGIERAEIQADIDDFYATVFPNLSYLTEPKPEAIALVEYAIACGYQVVIATNPLFPRSAILQRLEWADLSPEEFPFKLIASYETFHFAKPNPAFFAEILARVGWPDGPVVVVGDELENDIYASRRLGIPAFWVSQKGRMKTNGEHAPTASGSVADIIPWLDSTPPERLIPAYTSSTSVVTILRATPAALAALTDGLPPSTYTKRPKSNEWSLIEILCHLRDVEQEVHLPRVQKILDEKDPFLPGMVTDSWAEEREYICQDGPSALEAFTQTRKQALKLFDNINPEHWNQPARHAIFGPTDLRELVGIHAGHDRLHIQQLYETLNLISDRVQKV